MQFYLYAIFDDWTPQEFARFVYNDDYIKVDGEYAGSRPEREAAGVAQRLGSLLHLRILDYGSGSGRFADQLRSLGFGNVSSYDPFSSPGRPNGQFDVVTCFEVLEHTTSPHTTVADMASLLEPEGCMIFSTGIQPSTIGEIRANWWYVAPRNGHVSIYSLNSLARLGQAEGLLLRVGPGGTAFARTCASSQSRQILARIGRPLQFFQLTAPGSDDVTPPEQTKSWHGIEGSGSASFRWTREAEIIWRVQTQKFEPCGLSVDISILNEIQPGFAERCHLEVGKKSARLVHDGGLLRGSLEVEEPTEGIVKLVMPPLLRPCDLRPVSDGRSLGLAIACRPA